MFFKFLALFLSLTLYSYALEAEIFDTKFVKNVCQAMDIDDKNMFVMPKACIDKNIFADKQAVCIVLKKNIICIAPKDRLNFLINSPYTISENKVHFNTPYLRIDFIRYRE